MVQEPELPMTIPLNTTAVDEVTRVIGIPQGEAREHAKVRLD